MKKTVWYLPLSNLGIDLCWLRAAANDPDFCVLSYLSRKSGLRKKGRNFLCSVFLCLDEVGKNFSWQDPSVSRNMDLHIDVPGSDCHPFSSSLFVTWDGCESWRRQCLKWAVSGIHVNTALQMEMEWWLSGCQGVAITGMSLSSNHYNMGASLFHFFSASRWAAFIPRLHVQPWLFGSRSH